MALRERLYCVIPSANSLSQLACPVVFTMLLSNTVSNPNLESLIKAHLQANPTHAIRKEYIL